MRMWLAVVCSSAALLSLSACGSDPEPEPAPSPIPAPSGLPNQPPQWAPPDIERSYIDILEGEYGNVTDAVMLGYGYAVCDYIEESGAESFIYDVLPYTDQYTGYANEVNAFAAGLAVGHFCPEFQDDITAATDGATSPV